jgi:hypothetical protein
MTIKINISLLYENIAVNMGISLQLSTFTDPLTLELPRITRIGFTRLEYVPLQ